MWNGEEQTRCLYKEVYFETKIPLLGSVVDKLIQVFFGRLNEAFKLHMVEEDQNLKRIMEEGTQ